MKKRTVFVKIFAIAGTALVWFPVLTPVVLSTIEFSKTGRLQNFDYLMPAELFPFALLGGVMLIWASIRARLQRKLIGWSLGTAFFSPIVGQLLAMATGLASGAREPVGWQWALVLSMLVVYSLALVMAGVGGVMLIYDLFRSPNT